jgi:hypothetical protein
MFGHLWSSVQVAVYIREDHSSRTGRSSRAGHSRSTPKLCYGPLPKLLASNRKICNRLIHYATTWSRTSQSRQDKVCRFLTVCLCNLHWYDKSLEQETDYHMQEIPAIELERESSSSPITSTTLSVDGRSLVTVDSDQHCWGASNLKASS